jgi:hypothetical protein
MNRHPVIIALDFDFARDADRLMSGLGQVMRSATEGRADSDMKLPEESSSDCALGDLVGQGVRRAMQMGMDGIIVGSPVESGEIRKEAGLCAILITRKRVATPAEAIRTGPAITTALSTAN